MGSEMCIRDSCCVVVASSSASIVFAPDEREPAGYVWEKSPTELTDAPTLNPLFNLTTTDWVPGGGEFASIFSIVLKVLGSSTSVPITLRQIRVYRKLSVLSGAKRTSYLKRCTIAQQLTSRI